MWLLASRQLTPFREPCSKVMQRNQYNLFLFEFSTPANHGFRPLGPRYAHFEYTLNSDIPTKPTQKMPKNN